MADKAIDAVMDAIDIETYLICRDAQEGRLLALKLGQDMNLGDVDIMYEEFDGFGVRLRLRKYFHKPGAHYPWLEK